MQPTDYNTLHHQNLFPPATTNSPPPPPHHLIDHRQNSFASAPPFTTSNYTPCDYSVHSSSHPQPPYPISSPPPSAPSYPPAATAPSLSSSNFWSPPSQPLSTQQQPSFPPYDSHGPFQPPSTAQQSYYSSYDQHQTALNYASPPPDPSYSATSYTPVVSSLVLHASDTNNSNNNNNNLFENSLKVDHAVGCFHDKHAIYNGGLSNFGSDIYGGRSRESSYADGFGDGVYAYEGSKLEPYGAKGTASKSSTWTMFDDYGRAINLASGNDSSSVSFSSGSGNVVRAIQKAETEQDVNSGVQKFRVKLLAEGGGQSTMDVLCQIGLDGIRMLDPDTGRTLRVYPLENITNCEKTDSSTFAFWSKSSVDIEPRRIRLQSNSYTTNTLLDAVTAATVQLKEIGETRGPPESSVKSEQTIEKKKGFADWMNLIKPGNEEKDHWVPDEAVSKCTACGADFGAFMRKHHCRNCGDIFCDKCTHGRIALTADENAQPVRVCDRCMAEVIQRLTGAARESATKSPGLQSHEDLARKLQEEMEKNRKASLGSELDGSGKRMKEVACPTCTVHLQVQVPSSGSETIECGVCQHPFLVSAN